MNIKRLCLANGDEYENVEVSLDLEGLIEIINSGKVLIMELEEKKIIINSEFIISFEIGESKKLKII